MEGMPCVEYSIGVCVGGGGASAVRHGADVCGRIEGGRIRVNLARG